jgi:hypothetical protein
MNYISTRTLISSSEIFIDFLFASIPFLLCTVPFCPIYILCIKQLSFNEKGVFFAKDVKDLDTHETVYIKPDRYQINAFSKLLKNFNTLRFQEDPPPR